MVQRFEAMRINEPPTLTEEELIDRLQELTIELRDVVMYNSEALATQGRAIEEGYGQLAALQRENASRKRKNSGETTRITRRKSGSRKRKSTRSPTTRKRTRRRSP